MLMIVLDAGTLPAYRDRGAESESDDVQGAAGGLRRGDDVVQEMGGVAIRRTIIHGEVFSVSSTILKQRA